jgi:hypothetical protein
MASGISLAHCVAALDSSGSMSDYGLRLNRWPVAALIYLAIAPVNAV